MENLTVEEKILGKEETQKVKKKVRDIYAEDAVWRVDINGNSPTRFNGRFVKEMLTEPEKAEKAKIVKHKDATFTFIRFAK